MLFFKLADETKANFLVDGIADCGLQYNMTKILLHTSKRTAIKFNVELHVSCVTRVKALLPYCPHKNRSQVNITGIKIHTINLINL